MTPEAKQLIEFATQDLVAEIAERESLSIQDAMSRLYHSEFFQQLRNPEFGLYRESGGYLYHEMQKLESSSAPSSAAYQNPTDIS